MVLMLATGRVVFANLSGIGAILYHAAATIAEVGSGGTYGPILATVGVGTLNVLATIVAMSIPTAVIAHPKG